MTLKAGGVAAGKCDGPMGTAGAPSASAEVPRLPPSLQCPTYHLRTVVGWGTTQVVWFVQTLRQENIAHALLYTSTSSRTTTVLLFLWYSRVL